MMPKELLKKTKRMTVLGVSYYLPAELGIGHSFFIPSLKHKDTFEEIQRCYKVAGYTLTWEERIENDLLGIRVWRVA